jgi:hypothetical protein
MPIARLGPDFIVNTTATSNQFNPSMTALAGGGFVMVWDSYDSGDGGDPPCIRARLFDSAGQPAGVDFVLNTTGVNTQRTPSVAALSGGGFVASWVSYDGADGSGACIRARLFDAAGQALGADFVVNSTAPNSQSETSVAALSDGRFLVTWMSVDSGDGSGYCVRGRLFDAVGSPIADDFILGNTFTADQHDPCALALSDGRILITWSSADTGDGDRGCVRGRFYSAEGAPLGADFILNTTTEAYQEAPSVCELTDGRVVVTWYSSTGFAGQPVEVRARIFQPDGSAAPDFLVNTGSPSRYPFPTIAALADGRFVVAWRDSALTGAVIHGQLFNVDGSASGEEFAVNTTPVTFPSEYYAQPQVIGLPDGRFVVNWQSYDTGDGTDSCIRAAYFDPTRFIGDGAADQWTGGNFADRIHGGGGDDILAGLKGKDWINSGRGDDRLDGGDGNDRLVGDDGDDQLTGGRGADKLTGGAGADSFIFGDPKDSKPIAAARDTIADFSQTDGDIIDLSGIDADATQAGDQAFHLAGAAFTGNAGELIQTASAGGTLLSGDINGDGAADFAILLATPTTLTSDDFWL